MEKRFTYDAAFKRKVIICTEKIGNHAAGIKHAVRQSIKTELFLCLTNSLFLDQGKGEILRLMSLFLSI